MRVGFHLAAALGLLLFSGCVRERMPSSAPPTASAYGEVATNAPHSSQNVIITPAQALEGKVSWVNSNLRFVVMTFPVGQMPATDQRLSVYRHGLKVGEVKTTGPQRDDNIVGDIIAGDAATGDTIRDR